MLFFCLLVGLLSFPSIQTSLGSYTTRKINKSYGTDIEIDKVRLHLNGDIELKSVLIKDHFEVSMISVSKLNTSILNFVKIIDNQFVFGDIELDSLFFHIKTYKGEIDSNLDIFVNKFDKQELRGNDNLFLLSSSSLVIKNSIFRVTDENKNI